MKKTMNIILVILGVFLLGFVGTMIWIYLRTGGIPDTLVTCTFAVCGGECGVMGWIKTTKERMQERQWQIEDEEAAKHDQLDRIDHCNSERGADDCGRAVDPRENGR